MEDRSSSWSRLKINKHGRHLTIGLFTSRLDRGYHRSTWFNVAQIARELDFNLICYDGGILAAKGEPGWQGNVLYDLVDPDHIDGLLIWGGCLEWASPPLAVEALCEGNRRVPLVSVGRAVKGIPSILADNYQGMHEAISHLIEVHGHRRIAFLRGPRNNTEEALRYRAYVDVLEKHGMPLNTELVSEHVNWERATGAAMMRLLLDDRGLRPGRDFDAIASVGDEMACGAIQVLQSRGLRVPEDIPITGFNDDDEGRASMPALTTVHQSAEDMGQRAMTTLLALLDGQDVPERTMLPVRLIVRRSCGCLSNPVTAAVSRGVTPDLIPASDLVIPNDQQRAEIVAEMVQALGAAAETQDTARAGSLLSAFVTDQWAAHRGNRAGDFLAALDEILVDISSHGRDVHLWHNVLSVLRQHMMVYLHSPAMWLWAEDKWQQARVLVAETALQASRYRRFHAEQRVRLLSGASQAMAVATDLNDLLETIRERLPHLGVNACYLVLYEDGTRPAGDARLVLAYDHHNAGPLIPRTASLVEAGAVFPAPTLFPLDSLRDDRRYHLIAVPLYFGERHLGFALLDVEPAAVELVETVRDEISSALEGVLLREDLRQAWQQAEAANKMKSRFLATVSHELRTPLSLIVGTSEIMLREAEADSGNLPLAYRRDLDSIHASAQHLADLIGDVLDLASSQAGELRLVCRPHDIRGLLQEVSRLAEPLARARGLVWRTDIPPKLPLVWADSARLRQVTVNLVINAIKFTDRGSITLAAQAGADEVTVSVIDSGVGIPAAEQQTIFDEFRQSQRTAGRGYGGMGLGLAISRRLIELHQGRIGVRSSGEEGHGSTFFFTLPILQQREEMARNGSGRDSVVLLLTARPEGAAALRQHLSERGFNVELLRVTPQSDWLTGIVADPPGAVVLDFEPAAERGWELMKRLRENPKTESLPVVFYSLDEKGESGNILDLALALKPLDLRALTRTLGQGTGNAATASPDTPPAEIKTVLLVDDDPGLLDLHVRLIETQLSGWRTQKARNGVEALRIMEERRPDLVLLDLMMPEMDGFSVLEIMRTRAAIRDVPVVVLTAQILTDEDMERLRQGVAAVLDKGIFSRQEVLGQIEAALARSKRVGSEAQRLVRRAMAFIHEHYGEDLTRENLAESVGVSERYLTRCFGQEIGLTPSTYLTRYRIKQARLMLEQGHMNVTEVALVTGFSDSNYFGKVFRQVVGVSPRAYARGERPQTA